MKVVVAAGGRFHAFHLVQQLEKRNLLKRFFTASYSKKDQDYISSKLVSNNNLISSIDYFFSKARLSKFISKSKFFVFKDNLFDYWLGNNIKDVGKVDIFVGWAHYFLNSIPNIRKTGAKIIIECGSTHILEQQKLLQEEYDKFGIKYSPISKKNIEKILLEYDQSDYIMTCSNFTYNSFIKHGISKKKILKVPYGVDLDLFVKNDTKNPSLRYGLQPTQGKLKNWSGDKFRVICVGLMCLRKGIPYLLKAWKKLNLPKDKTELLFVGNIQKDLKEFLKSFDLPENVVFYGSVDRNTISKLYKQSCIFVLPSIEEGLSMTIVEAMASGLPVICTTNTGGEDLIENEKEGLIVPIRNVDALAEKIQWCYDNRQLACQMGCCGQQKVKNFTWDIYGQKVYEAYKSIL